MNLPEQGDIIYVHKPLHRVGMFLYVAQIDVLNGKKRFKMYRLTKKNKIDRRFSHKPMYMMESWFSRDDLVFRSVVNSVELEEVKP